MRARSSAVPLGLIAAVVCLSVAMAGCLAQDRPREPSFTIVADAGGAVVQEGTQAHLAWTPSQAIEAEAGEGPAEPADIEWTASDGAHSSGASFDFTPGAAFVLVQLNVTAENRSATDVGGVLSVPPQPGAARAYIGIVGDVELETLQGGSPLSANVPVDWQGNKGHYYSATAVGPEVNLRIVQGAEGGEAAFFIHVVPGSGSADNIITKPLHFDAGVTYTLMLDTYVSGHDRISVGSGGDSVAYTLSAYGDSNGGETESRVVIAPAGQGLPGMDAAPAVVALGATAALALVRRRR